VSTLTCSQSQSMMSELLDECLSASNAARVTSHIESCADCRRHWQSMQRLSAIFGDVGLAQPPPDFTGRVMNQIAARYNVTGHRTRQIWLPSGALATALVLASIAILAFATPDAGSPWPLVADGSLSALDLTMVASRVLLQTAGTADQVLRLAATVGQLVPAPAFIGLFMWLAFGAFALSITLGALLYAYRPAVLEATQSTEPVMQRHD